MKIRVATEQLRAAADNAEKCIDKMSRKIEMVTEVVRGSGRYWEGEGQEAFVRSYWNHVEKSGKALDAFRDNVNDLREIAGIYDATESAATEESQPLPSDVIR